ncbi:MAG TPA: trigger factor [Solirubrobacterales bacterium]|nr:trigger factor [Solirubrobacterales bacterium]
MKTELTELPESRVRLDVSVEPDVVAKRIDRAAKQLAGEMKMPGFRKGKVPPQLVIQRIGREAVLEQAVRDSLPEWYEEAIVASGLATVGDPKLDVDKLPDEGEGLEFAIEIGVRPLAELGDYKDLEVGKTDVEVPEDAISEEIERLREGFGSLNPVDRASENGDVVVIDYEGSVDGEVFEGGTGQDMTVELGSERLLPEFEAGLVGKSAGEEAELDVTFPDDYGAEDLAGKAAVFKVKVNEVREKELPALDDLFAQSASEFDTLEELREEIRSRLAEALEQRSDMEFRDAAVDVAAQNAKVDLPHDIVHARAHELWERFERTLQARGIDPQMYAQMQGKDRHAMIDEGEESAEKTLRREATLAAVAEAEGIEPTDEDLIEALGTGDGKQNPEKVLAKLREAGREGMLREEVRLRKAAELIADSAKPIAVSAAEAREAIWTPEKGESEPSAEDGEETESEAPGKLWTPGP